MRLLTALVLTMFMASVFAMEEIDLRKSKYDFGKLQLDRSDVIWELNRSEASKHKVKIKFRYPQKEMKCVEWDVIPGSGDDMGDYPRRPDHYICIKWEETGKIEWSKKRITLDFQKARYLKDGERERFGLSCALENNEVGCELSVLASEQKYEIHYQSRRFYVVAVPDGF